MRRRLNVLRNLAFSLWLALAPVGRGAADDAPLDVPESHALLSVPATAPQRLTADGLPNFLQGALIYRPPASGKDPRQGRLECTVERGGPVYLLATWKSDGRASPEVAAEMIKREQLLTQGWVSLGPTHWQTDYELFVREFAAGETFQLRMRVNRPPQLVTAPAIEILFPTEEPQLSRRVIRELTHAEVRSRLERQDYDWLEQTAARLRSNRTRDYYQVPKLLAFYDGLTVDGCGERSKYDWPAQLAALEAWRQARPDSTVPIVALADFHLDYAWNARGRGFSDTVTDEGARLYEERLREARRLCRQALAVADDDPNVYAVLVECAKGLADEDERVRDYVNASYHVDPYFVRTLTNASAYFLPRWYGEPETLPEFADWAASLSAGEFGEGLYAYVVEMTQNYHGRTVFDDFDFDWDRTKAGLEALMDRFGQDALWASRACRLAQYQRDREFGAALLAWMGESFHTDVFENRTEFNRFRVANAPGVHAGEHRRLHDGHSALVHELKVSADGRRLVTAGWDFRVLVWDRESGALLQEFYEQNLYPELVAFTHSPDVILIGYADGKLAVGDVRSGRRGLLATLSDKVNCLEIAADGSVFAVGASDGTVSLFDARTGAAHATIDASAHKKLEAIALTADGTRLATVGTDGEVRLWNTLSGEAAEHWPVGKSPGAAVFSPDGRSLAVSHDGKQVTLWSVETQEQEATCTMDAGVVSVAFSPKQPCVAIACSSGDAWVNGGAYVWKYATGDPPGLLKGHHGGVRSLRFSTPDATLITGGVDWTVREWAVP